MIETNQLINAVTPETDNAKEVEALLENIRRNPDTALSNINNMKIKLEMEKKAIEDKITQIEEELSKVSNPTILNLLAEIESADTVEDLNGTSVNLQTLENKVLQEIESMLKEDGELINTLSKEYSNVR